LEYNTWSPFSNKKDAYPFSDKRPSFLLEKTIHYQGKMNTGLGSFGIAQQNCTLFRLNPNKNNDFGHF
jgi:hypothetical protein